MSVDLVLHSSISPFFSLRRRIGCSLETLTGIETLGEQLPYEQWRKAWSIPSTASSSFNRGWQTESLNRRANVRRASSSIQIRQKSTESLHTGAIRRSSSVAVGCHGDVPREIDEDREELVRRWEKLSQRIEKSAGERLQGPVSPNTARRSCQRGRNVVNSEHELKYAKLNHVTSSGVGSSNASLECSGKAAGSQDAPRPVHHRLRLSTENLQQLGTLRHQQEKQIDEMKAMTLGWQQRQMVRLYIPNLLQPNENVFYVYKLPREYFTARH